MNRRNIANGVKNIIGRILEIISDAQVTPDLTVELRQGKLSLSADLRASVGTSRVKSSGSASAGAIGDDVVSPEAVLAVLDKKIGGMNLAKIGKALGVRKMAVRGVLTSLLAQHLVEKAGPVWRLPGRVRRGRPGRNKKRTARVVPPVAVVTTLTAPRPSLVKDKPAGKKETANKRPAAKVVPSKPSPAPKKGKPAIPPRKPDNKAPASKKPATPAHKARPPRPEARQRTAPVPTTGDEPVTAAPVSISPDEVAQAAPATENSITPPEVGAE